MTRLLICMVLSATAAAGQTLQDLDDEAEAIRAKLLARHERFRGEGPPWLRDRAAEAFAVAETAAKKASDAFFAARGEVPPERISYHILIGDMLTPQGEGAEY
ncbi:MAG: hypothetical protein AAFN41_03640, partial [Planctomycetota bacterium]